MKEIINFYEEGIKKRSKQLKKIRQEKAQRSEQNMKTMNEHEGRYLSLLETRKKLTKMQMKLKQNKQPKTRSEIEKRQAKLNDFIARIPLDTDQFVEFLQYYKEEFEKSQYLLENLTNQEYQSKYSQKLTSNDIRLRQFQNAQKPVKIQVISETKKDYLFSKIDQEDKRKSKKFQNMYQSPSAEEDDEQYQPNLRGKGHPNIKSKGQKYKNQKPEKSKFREYIQQEYKHREKVKKIRKPMFSSSSQDLEEIVNIQNYTSESNEDDQIFENKMNTFVPSEEEEDDATKQKKLSQKIKKGQRQLKRKQHQFVQEQKLLVCQGCSMSFKSWKFQNCSNQCKILICKKCAGKLYSSVTSLECVGCFEFIKEREIENLKN